MSIRSGLAAQIGFAEETTWGTRVAPTRFLEFNSESLKLEQSFLDSKGIRASNLVQRSDRWARGKKSVSGDVEIEGYNLGLSMLLKHALGSVAISTPTGATATRRHTHTLGDNYGLGLTVQVGRPDTGGTVRAFEYAGCKVPSLEIGNSVDELLLLNLGFVGKDEDTAQSLGAASYPASTEILNWSGGVLNIAAAAMDVQDVSIKIERGHNERFRIRSDRATKEPIMNDLVKISGEVTAEFESLTAYNRFVNGTLAALDVTWTGGVIEGAFSYYLKVTLNNVRFEGETPSVDGPDVLMQKLPFMAVYDGSNGPISIEYQTTDTAV